jgi:hypothetical protein
MIHQLIDRLSERYGEGEHKLEAMRAREEYFERAGKVFDDDAELFEGRMAAFLEWYVLDRPFAGGAVPPVVRLLETDKALSVEERRALAALATTHRSLFQLYSETDRVLDIEDVIGGARFRVRERRSTVGIAPGDLFEARLCWDGTDVIFGRTFLFHPPDTRDVILDWIERTAAGGASRAEMLFHLSRLYVRWHRLGHTGAAKVYREG